MNALQHSLEKPEPLNVEERFQFLFSIVTDIMGDVVLSKTKERKAVIARRLIAYQMRLDDISYRKIGLCLNIDRTTASLSYEIMQRAFEYPKMYSQEIHYWVQFQKRLKEKEDDKTRTIQSNSRGDC